MLKYFSVEMEEVDEEEENTDRMKRLQEFQKKKLALKVEAAKTKKPPFKVGLYKPDMAIVRPGT